MFDYIFELRKQKVLREGEEAEELGPGPGPGPGALVDFGIFVCRSKNAGLSFLQ